MQAEKSGFINNPYAKLYWFLAQDDDTSKDIDNIRADSK